MNPRTVFFEQWKKRRLCEKGSCEKGPCLSVFVQLVSVLLFGMFLVGSLTGCANSSPASLGSQGIWTPVDHARAQLNWIQNSAGDLTAEELFHARNTPWSGKRLTPAEREQWIRQQLMEVPGAEEESLRSGRRLLDRPPAMEAALERWQRELQENQSN